MFCRLAHNLSHTISPILPHLSAEVLHHLPGCHEKRILRQKLENLHSGVLSPDPKLSTLMKIIIEVRSLLEASAGPTVDTSKKVNEIVWAAFQIVFPGFGVVHNSRVLDNIEGLFFGTP